MRGGAGRNPLRPRRSRSGFTASVARVYNAAGPEAEASGGTPDVDLDVSGATGHEMMSRRSFALTIALVAVVGVAAIGTVCWELLRLGWAEPLPPENPSLAYLVWPRGVPPAPEMEPTSRSAIAAGIHGKENILFWRGIHNGSTAPSLLLVTVVNATTRERYKVCVERNEFIRALALEHGKDLRSIPYNDLIQFAVAQPKQTFVFSRPEALKLVQRRYDDRVLREAHQALDHLSDSELIAGFGPAGHLRYLYARYEWPEVGAWISAIGEVILERGLLPGFGDVDASLYVTR